MGYPIDGFGIAGFRSFGEKIQRVAPCKKINFLIGQNNSGKSNILLFLENWYGNSLRSIRANQITKLQELDYHLGTKTKAVTVEFAMRLNGEIYQEMITHLKSNPAIQSNLKFIELILKSDFFSDQNELTWRAFTAEKGQRFSESEELATKAIAANILADHEWNRVWKAIRGASGGDFKAHWVPETLSALNIANKLRIPKVDVIPAIRKIGDPGTPAANFGGEGLIDRLAQLQNPSHDKQELKARFKEINQFLRTVTENETATLEIPFERDMILVHMDGKTLPLSSLGTGIHEVVILAAAATVLTDQVLCIEEPELHLHPLLQKKLVRYLAEKTNNQYFITTHSAHVLDTPDAAIFHVRYQDGQSTIDPAFTATEKASICADLGYRATDLMQSNCVIWVEGPSDRIYIKHWIQAIETDLEEGIDYSIMFYGGRLLSHLTAEDEVENFISLRKLNRYIAIVIDSDKKSQHASINETKKRLVAEFNQGPGFAWVTKGREIENYVDVETLTLAIKSVYPKAKKTLATGQFDHRLPFVTALGKEVTDIDKVRVAHKVADIGVPKLEVLDLEKHVKKLVAFIRASNEHTVPTE